MMNNFYYVTKEQLKDLDITTDKDTVICLNNSPFRNWIVGFDIFEDSPERSEEFSLGMEYEALKIPQDVSDSEIIGNNQLLGETIRDIVREALNRHLEESLKI